MPSSRGTRHRLSPTSEQGAMTATRQPGSFWCLLWARKSLERLCGPTCRTWGLELCGPECKSSLLKLHSPPLIRTGMIFVALGWCGEALLLVGRENVRRSAGPTAGSGTGSGTPASLVQTPSAQVRPNLCLPQIWFPRMCSGAHLPSWSAAAACLAAP